MPLLHRIALAATGALLLPPARAWSQNCMGTVPFSEWPTRVGVAYSKPNGNAVRTGFIGAERDALFAEGSYSRIHPLPDTGAGRNGREYGAELGYDWRVWHGLYVCPTLTTSSGLRNGVLLASRTPASEPTDHRYLAFGGVVGPSSGMHGGIVISPTAGLWLARDRTNGGAELPASVRIYGFANFGLGLVILRRFTTSLLYEREFATPNAAPMFFLFKWSADLGP